MEKKHNKPAKHGRSRSFSGAGLASFLRSTVASFSSSTFPSSSSSSRAGANNARSSFNHRNAFSGPIVSIVPPEARGRRGNKQQHRSGYRTPEPSSPKVSCIGQIKRCNSRSSKKVNPATTSACRGGACPLPPRPPPAAPEEKRRGDGGSGRPKRSLVKRMSFFRRSRSRSSRSSSSSKDGGKKGAAAAAAASAPEPQPAGLGHMKRFTSGRAAFQDFDWREAEIIHGADDEDDDGFVAHSAPLVLGGGVVAAEPRKEVNLWRRRPMAPPAPLQLP